MGIMMETVLELAGLCRVLFACLDGSSRGLVLRRGPKDKGNRRVLAGTVLQNAPWEEVVEYGKGMRWRPLW
jgi:hypothetical protein